MHGLDAAEQARGGASRATFVKLGPVMGVRQGDPAIKRRLLRADEPQRNLPPGAPVRRTQGADSQTAVRKGPSYGNRVGICIGKVACRLLRLSTEFHLPVAQRNRPPKSRPTCLLHIATGRPNERFPVVQ